MYVNTAIPLHIEGCISYVANRIAERSNLVYLGTMHGTESLATGRQLFRSRTNWLRTGNFPWQPWFWLQFGGALVFSNSDLFGSFSFPAVLKITLFFAIPGDWIILLSFWIPLRWGCLLDTAIRLQAGRLRNRSSSAVKRRKFISPPKRPDQLWSPPRPQPNR